MTRVFMITAVLYMPLLVTSPSAGITMYFREQQFIRKYMVTSAAYDYSTVEVVET